MIACTPGTHFETRAEGFAHLLRCHTGLGEIVNCECGRWRAITDRQSPRRINIESGASSCFGKKAYIDEAQATAAMHSRDFNGRVYACNLCERWHMTKRR